VGIKNDIDHQSKNIYKPQSGFHWNLRKRNASAIIRSPRHICCHFAKHFGCLTSLLSVITDI
jgi:hypothetical protein